MFIRFFARTDESELGRQAAAYCDALVATGLPVRLVSIRLEVDGQGRASSVWGRTASCWERHRELLSTDMEGGFANVVCGDVDDWGKLWTANCVNLLFIGDANMAAHNTQPAIMEAIGKYDYVFTPSAELATVVERVTGLRPVVVARNPEHAGVHLRTYVK